MQDLKLFNNVTMSSLEIAELIDKRHDNVMRDIRKLMEELNELKIEEREYVDSRGKIQPMYELDEESTLTLVSGYNRILRNKIIRRWKELEQEKAFGGFKLPKSYKEAVSQLLDVIEEKEILEEQAKLNKPKVEAYDKSKVIFSTKESVYDEERGFKKYVKDIYPFLSNDKISLILDYYTTSKYKDTDHYIKSELDCVSTFFTEAEMNISASKDTVVVTHPCLLTNTIRIRKDKAIRYLDYTEEQFK